jgi:hypothetical protein
MLRDVAPIIARLALNIKKYVVNELEEFSLPGYLPKVPIKKR